MPTRSPGQAQAQTPPNIQSLAPPKHFFLSFFNAEGTQLCGVFRSDNLEKSDRKSIFKLKMVKISMKKKLQQMTFRFS